MNLTVTHIVFQQQPSPTKAMQLHIAILIEHETLFKCEIAWHHPRWRHTSKPSEFEETRFSWYEKHHMDCRLVICCSGCCTPGPEKFFSSENNKVSLVNRNFRFVQKFLSLCQGVFSSVFCENLTIIPSSMTGNRGPYLSSATWEKLQHKFPAPKPAFSFLGLPSFSPAVVW